MPFPRTFGSIQPLPNHLSRHRTPATTIYDLHWANLQLLDRWTWERFARFAAFLRHTPYELGSLVTMRHDVVDRFQRTNRISGGGCHAVAVLLTLLEAHLLAEWQADVIRNPFPKLSSQPAYDGPKDS